jgi:urease accessory protein
MFRIVFLTLVALPGAAFAHSGAAAVTPLLAGLSHPIGGADHILAMLGVGLWASILGGRAILAMPLAFLVAMLMGGGLGAYGFAAPGVEPMIAASIIGIGAATALALRPALPLALCALAVFGAAHGFAHGVEGPSTGGFAYVAGFGLMTAGLHCVGLAIGLTLLRRGTLWLPRGLGLATAMAGLGLAGGAL